MHTSITYISALPSSFPSVLPSLHPLSPLPNRKPRVARSPYPVDRKATTPFTPGRKAYNRVKGMFSGFKSIKSLKTASTTGGSDAHAPGGQLALGHVNNTQVECNEAPAPARTEDLDSNVRGGQLAPGHAKAARVQPREAERTDEHYGWAQVAKTSARFLSTVLDCPETLPSTDPSEVHPDLAHFISFALRRLSMPLCVHQYALHLVWRVKALNPSFQPKHAHGTYLTALMLAAKNSHDTDYLLGDWALIGQDIFEPGQLRENEWRMCERLGWKLTVHPMELVKTTWAIEMEYGEIFEDVPSSEPIARTGSEVGLGGMFAGSVASSLSELSIPSSRSLCSPWSGWGVDSPMHSLISTPHGANPICASSIPSPLVLA